jgi:uncharacterized protein YjbI with pentapeptide repeats
MVHPLDFLVGLQNKIFMQFSSLTQFVNYHSIALRNQTRPGGFMITVTNQNTELNSADSYQMIKDEHLDSIVVSAQVLAGSRILLSSYKQVVFVDCVFYACEFQGVTFDNCVFENCSFQFSHIRRSEFKNCNFENCTWRATTTTNTIYSNCDLDNGLTSITTSGRNQIQVSEIESSGLHNFNLMAA